VWKIDEVFSRGEFLARCWKSFSSRLTRGWMMKVFWYQKVKKLSFNHTITLYVLITRSVHLNNFINSQCGVLLVVLGKVGVVLKRLIALFAEVNARLIVYKKHVLAKVGRCFAHVIALPAAERFWIHVNPEEIKVVSLGARNWAVELPHVNVELATLSELQITTTALELSFI
jgi:hypothetical protein